MKTEDVQIRHTFGVPELAEMGRDQAQKLDSLMTLKSDLDSVKKQYASQISEHEAGVQRISSKIHAGWEIRNVKCAMLDERPEGFRIIVRLDNGHIVQKRKLGDHERQLSLTAEEPKEYWAIALLKVDDKSWDADVYEVPIYEDEFQALRGLDVVSMRPWAATRRLPEAGQQPQV